MEMNPNGTGHPGHSTDTGSTDTQRGHPLPCGRTVEQVWEAMEFGRVDAHAADCPHCTTARAGLEQLAEATRLLVADPVDPPVGLLDKVMAAVRADLAHGETIPLPAPPGAVVDISTYALAVVLRFVVDGVTGVRAHRCRIVPVPVPVPVPDPDPDPVPDPDPDSANVPDDPHTVHVSMSVSLHYGSGRVGALEQARARVAAALSARIGLRLGRLDFEVADVWIDDDPGIDRAGGIGGAGGGEERA